MAQKFTVPVTIKNLSSAGSDGITVFLDQESFARLKVEAGGRITWGDGSGAGDTNLYRDEASVLKTDDTFKSAGLFVAGTQIDPTGATIGDALIFNGTKFVSASVAAGGGNTTVTVSSSAPESPEEGNLWFDIDIFVLYIYTTNDGWVSVSGSLTLDGLSDVAITSPTNGQMLTYNGTSWVNQNAPSGGGYIDGGAAGTVFDTPNIDIDGGAAA